MAFVVLGLAEPFPLDPAACDCCCGLPGACDCDLPGAGVVADTFSHDVVTVTTGATPGLDSTTTADDVLLGFPIPIELMSVQLQSSIVTVREEVSATVAVLWITEVMVRSEPEPEPLPDPEVGEVDGEEPALKGVQVGQRVELGVQVGTMMKIHFQMNQMMTNHCRMVCMLDKVRRST